MKANHAKLTCFYCDAVYFVAKSAQGDHFPVPQRHGGTQVVPCCRECHSLKDRISFNEWNGGMISKVISDFPKMNRETRIFLAKTMCALQDAKAVTTISNWLSQAPDGLTPVVFDAGEIVHGVKIERVLQQSGAIMWAVRDSCNQCLDHSGNWDYEWQPSDKTPAYLQRCRFATLQNAYNALIKYRNSL